jgi:flagellar export protein FliJ
MKRYRFALESVLRLRRAQEEAARMALATANRGLHHATLAYRGALARYEDVTLDDGHQDVASFRRERDQAERRADALAAALATVDRASQEVRRRHSDWSAAAQLVAALEHLDERRRAEWRIEEQRAEMAAIDESALAGWLADVAAPPPVYEDAGIPA